MKRIIDYLRLKLHVKKLQVLANIYEIQTNDSSFSKAIKARILEQLSPSRRPLNHEQFERDIFHILVKFESGEGDVDCVEEGVSQILKALYDAGKN